MSCTTSKPKPIATTLSPEAKGSVDEDDTSTSSHHLLDDADTVGTTAFSASSLSMMRISSVDKLCDHDVISDVGCGLGGRNAVSVSSSDDGGSNVVEDWPFQRDESTVSVDSTDDEDSSKEDSLNSSEDDDSVGAFVSFRREKSKTNIEDAFICQSQRKLRTLRDHDNHNSSLEFSYGSFNMSLNEGEFVPEKIGFALRHTPQLKCDNRLQNMKLRRSSVTMKFPTLCVPSSPDDDSSASSCEDDTFDEDVPPLERMSSEISRRTARKSTIQITRRSANRSGGRAAFEASFRRSAMTDEDITDLLDDIGHIEVTTKGKDWIRSFRGLDPRHQILEFFNDLSLEGIENYETQGLNLKGAIHIPRILRGFIRSGIFSVWRPTSNDAIRKMITGEGTGKGLDIKGKSAKCGAFSGYVPFLQIHENEHKKRVAPMRLHERVRVFYPNEASRESAATVLNMLSTSMSHVAKAAEKKIRKNLTKKMAPYHKTGGMGGLRTEMLMVKKNIPVTIASQRCLMHDPEVYLLDDYVKSQGVYGLDIPERLFWEGYVAPNDITRPQGSKYETGRPSMPEFQQMNIETLRHWEPCDTDPNPRPVLWHGDCGRIGEDAPEEYNPMCPRGLLMAYEENEQVIPVVSDFDCFLLGTRGVRYTEPLGEQEHTMLSQCVDDIEGILETPKVGSNWTQRWLEVKKQHAMEMSEDEPPQEMPKFGYADPRSYKIMTGAVNRLKSNGAVRHGPECFNYGFPQDLDDKYLVVSDTFQGVPWRYVNSEGLIDILSVKVEEGFTFPLNPKWVLCDQGWKKVYDQLLASQKANVQESMAIWYPDTIRKRLEEISTKYPGGFVDTSFIRNRSNGVQTDLAMLEFKNYQVRVNAEKKIQRALMRQRGTWRLIKVAQLSIEEEKDEEKASDASEPCNTGNDASEPCNIGSDTSEPCNTGNGASEPCNTSNDASEPCNTGNGDSEPCNTGEGDKKAGQAFKKPFKFIRHKVSFGDKNGRIQRKRQSLPANIDTYITNDSNSGGNPEWTTSHTIQSENNDRPLSRVNRISSLSGSLRSWATNHTNESEDNNRPPPRANRRTMSGSFRSGVKYMKRRLSLKEIV